MNTGKVLLLALGLLASSRVHARPEYAVQVKQNCMACHATVWGGGPRTVYGKNYGAHGNPPALFADTERIYADLRALGYYPFNRTSDSKSGVALMEAAVSGNLPLIKKENGSELRTVLTYNITPLNKGEVREAYARFQLPQKDPERATHITVGRFYVPFGLLTEEHRTYTRIQTNMTFNNYFLGAALSSDLLRDLHVDLVAVNDFQSNGAFVTGDVRWGSVANLRWNPTSRPFFLGLSGSYEHTAAYRDPSAASVYGALSFDKLTSNTLNAALLFERVDAWNWNNPIMNTGSSTPGLPSYFGALSSQAGHSTGYYSWFRYNFSAHWNAFYKLDYLDLNSNDPGERFTRHGVGVEFYPYSNIVVNARIEKAYVGNSNAKDSNVLAAQDDFFLMLRLWL